MRGGTRVSSRTLVVHGRSIATPRAARCGFVVGRSVGPAVVRNRVVRRLRHLMAARLGELPQGTDIVVRALPPAAHATSAELDRDLASAVRRAMSRLGQGASTVPAVSR